MIVEFWMGDVIKLRAARKQAKRVRDEKRAAANRLLHGRSKVYGYRFGAAAYLTDHSEIPPEAMEQLRGLDVLFLDALRHKPHPTHSTVERSMAYAEQLNPRLTYFTHICHELAHAKTESGLPPGRTP